jgi:hypothetical protein
MSWSWKRFIILVTCGLACALVGFVASYLSGFPIFQRGPWAAVCFLVCGTLFNAGVTGGRVLLKSSFPDRAALAPLPFTDAPTDKTKMREAVMGGVLEAIKGLVVRSENAEKEIKELKTRVSELSLAVGLRPRSARAPEQKP